MKLPICTAYLIEEQGISYLAEADLDSAFTPLQAAVCTYRIALGPKGGTESEDIAVYVFSIGREIGVDVGAVRELCDADDIAARFFSRCENEAYLTLERNSMPSGIRPLRP